MYICLIIYELLPFNQLMAIGQTGRRGVSVAKLAEVEQDHACAAVPIPLPPMAVFTV